MLRIVGGAENNDLSCKIRIIDCTTASPLARKDSTVHPKQWVVKTRAWKKVKKAAFRRNTLDGDYTGSAEDLPAWGE
jgi:hypothetical protein